MEQREEYNAWMDAVEHGAVVTLADYQRWLAYDSNLPWRLQQGHLANLLDEATDEIRKLELTCASLTELWKAASG